MKHPEPMSRPWWVIVLAALAIGVIAGLGAVVFRGMIAGIHNLLFLGELSFAYDANVHTAPPPWGFWIILVPVVGAVGVAFLVKTFAPEAKGHGVPEVMDAIYYEDGRIRPIVAVVKSVASALSIGSGGSVGREGPIIQIGAAFGSTVGQFIAMPARQRAVLIAAGAGGGIAATFNTPIGGIMFAIELMMPSVGPLSLLAVSLSTITATYIGQWFFGVMPAFDVPGFAQVEGPMVDLAIFPWFALFGLLIGVAAVAMLRGIYWFEDRFDAIPGNYYTRHMLGMLLVGLIMVGFLYGSSAVFGQPNHYYVQGVGYATIVDIFRGELSAVGFLLLLAVAKLLVTCLTLGSGASGGVFSPSLFTGAALGGCVGAALNYFAPSLGASPAHFAYAGMAAMIGGTTGATITGTVMVFEMTRNYTLILPVILTVVLAGAVRYGLSAPTIYTLKLLRRGRIVPQGLRAWMGEMRSANVMTRDFVLVSEEEARDEDRVRAALLRDEVVVVTGAQAKVCGVIQGTPSTRLTSYVTVDPAERLDEVLRIMDQAEATLALVCRSAAATGQSEVVGVVTDRHVAAAVRSAAKLLG
jgi:CIC family chloride channel protein